MSELERIYDEHAQALFAYLLRLTGNEADTFDREGLTFDKIAELLDIPLNTAASRYRYGRDKLRERLRPLYDEIQ